MLKSRRGEYNLGNQQVAEALGFNEAVDRTHLRDLMVVGGCPSGLAAWTVSEKRVLYHGFRVELDHHATSSSA